MFVQLGIEIPLSLSPSFIRETFRASGRPNTLDPIGVNVAAHPQGQWEMSFVRSLMFLVVGMWILIPHPNAGRLGIGGG